MPDKGLLIVFSGPSGTGKDTVLDVLLRETDTVKKSVSATTRAPREGERDGVDYHFISRDQFLSLIERGEMLEYAEYVGNFYGTPLGPVREWTEKGIDVILKIEVQGGAIVREKCPDSIGIFILPPSLEELKKRIRGRGSETEETMARRLGEALHEIHNIDKYDYRVINEDLDTAIDRVRAIITAEQCKINGEEVDWIVNKYKEDL